jgi:hypothetical protein
LNVFMVGISRVYADESNVVSRGWVVEKPPRIADIARHRRHRTEADYRGLLSACSIPNG